MDATPNLTLPYIMAAQSQKHVTHNEAIRALDAILQLAVLDRDLTVPPSSPANGARYIVGGSPTGAWSGHAGSIAAYQDGAWMFYAPVEGWIAWIGDEDAAVVWDGAAWSALTTGGGGGGGSGSYTTLGINATADTTNRLSLAADATLLNHDGDGHQLKINKASAADTASLLYQDAFSGRAELGLAGDDDFHFKVSPDGATWKEAILIDRSSGSVSFPHTSLGGGARVVLTANRTYYVRSDGSDSNTGLVNSSGGAFLTIQKAINVVAALDLSIYDVTIQVGAGTYTGTLTLQTLTGAGRVTIQGDTTTPANCLIAVTSATAVSAASIVGQWALTGFKTTTTTSGRHFNISGPTTTVTIGRWDFGVSADVHLLAQEKATVYFSNNYTISGNAQRHWEASVNALITPTSSITVTLSGTPAFSNEFVKADVLAYARGAGITYSGSATGTRYSAASGALINTGGGGTSFFPGNAAGATATGGQYL